MKILRLLNEIKCGIHFDDLLRYVIQTDWRPSAEIGWTSFYTNINDFSSASVLIAEMLHCRLLRGGVGEKVFEPVGRETTILQIDLIGLDGVEGSLTIVNFRALMTRERVLVRGVGRCPIAGVITVWLDVVRHPVMNHHHRSDRLWGLEFLHTCTSIARCVDESRTVQAMVVLEEDTSSTGR